MRQSCDPVAIKSAVGVLQLEQLGGIDFVERLSLLPTLLDVPRLLTRVKHRALNERQ